MLRCLLCYTPFFFLRLRPPPSSTLFPYTTLFRSRGVAHRDGRDRAVRRRLPQPARLRAITGREGPELHAQPGRVVLADQDRKSTRLNSSHRCISYAVFCLKKKKQKKYIKHCYKKA